jgi:hypothetical protein
MADQGSEIRPPQQRIAPTSIPVEHQLQLQRQELGLLGYLFGSRENAPFFIAGIIVILSFIGIFIVLLTNKDGDALKALSAFVFAALSFIGGYGTGRRR